MQKPPQLASSTNRNGAQSDGRKLMEDFHHYKGIIFRGWKFIVICVLASLTAAVIYIAAQKPTYKASSRLLVIQQGSHPVRVGGEMTRLMANFSRTDNLATHVLLLKSPVIIEQALKAGRPEIGLGWLGHRQSHGETTGRRRQDD